MKTSRITSMLFLVSVCMLGIAGPVSGATATAKATTKTVAVPKIEVAGWIPYWRTATGTAEALAHIDAFNEISPFGFTVKKSGELFDPMNIGEEPWTTLLKTAHDKKIKVFPTVMWSNGDAIDATLRSSKARANHVKSIVATVKQYGFDGIDIDYEGKDAKTNKYFSLFLRDLGKALGPKLLSCTIEARTPLADRFNVIPKDIAYANDFASIGTYCDRVRIMAYDQGAIDLRLNESVVGPYVPVADPKWVEKVVRLAMKTIAKKKIVIGVATYGYEYTVTPLQEGFMYDRETSFNPNYASNIASAYGVTPTRNEAGELSLIYIPTTTPLVSPTAVGPTTTPSLDTSTFGQNLVTTSTGTSSVPILSTKPFRLLWWSDAQAIQDKMTLAKKLGIRGIAIFKIDGGADPKLWDILKNR